MHKSGGLPAGALRSQSSAMVAAGGRTLALLFVLVLVLVLVPVLVHAGRARHAPLAEGLHYVEESLRNLRSMGPSLPDECLEEAVKFRISTRPRTIRKWSSLRVGLQLSSELLREDVSSAAWLPSCVTNLRKLLRRQTRLFSDSHQSRLKKKRMEKYFQELRDFLSREKLGRCAWELVRAELEQLFITFKRFFSSYAKGGGHKVEETKATRV